MALLANTSKKVNELIGKVGYFNEFGNISAMSFTEIWLAWESPDECISVDGFMVISDDHILVNTHSSRGCGLCIYINEKWCHLKKEVLNQHSCTVPL